MVGEHGRGGCSLHGSQEVAAGSAGPVFFSMANLSGLAPFPGLTSLQQPIVPQTAVYPSDRTSWGCVVHYGWEGSPWWQECAARTLLVEGRVDMKWAEL